MRVFKAFICNYAQLQSRPATDTIVCMLKSSIRLAQAHAWLMFRDEVTRLDAITYILSFITHLIKPTILAIPQQAH